VSQVEAVVLRDSDGSQGAGQLARVRRLVRGQSAWAYASAFAGEGADLMRHGPGHAAAPEDLDAEAIGSEAAERRRRLAWCEAGPSRRCPVVLDTSCGSFLGSRGMLSADAVQRGRSLFAAGGRRDRTPCCGWQTTARCRTAGQLASTARGSPGGGWR